MIVTVLNNENILNDDITEITIVHNLAIQVKYICKN